VSKTEAGPPGGAGKEGEAEIQDSKFKKRPCRSAGRGRRAKLRFKIQNSRNVLAARRGGEVGRRCDSRVKIQEMSLPLGLTPRPLTRTQHHGRDGHGTGNVAQGPLSGPAALLACGGPWRDARGNFDGRKPEPRRKGSQEKPQGWRASLALRFAGLRFAGRPAPPDRSPTLPRRR
jgi:hypothetical protein